MDFPLSEEQADRERSLHTTVSPAAAKASRPSARYQNFWLHMRPRTYPRAALRFTHTFHLGFFAVFLLAVEIVTGLALMVYYTPTPEGAYASILRLNGQVVFGALFRDLHRLAGEALIVCVALHLFRTYLTDAYKGERRFTWVTGVGLLLFTLGLGFSGYLLPWDQRSYWAVTIGTSMVEAIPLAGHWLNLVLRGGPTIGAGGLMRFYLAHVLLLPLAGALLLGVHYYRVSRRHGLSLPVELDTGSRPERDILRARDPVPFIPEVLRRDVSLGCLALFLLVLAARFFYDAPLGPHADPTRTPLDTQAPWFFLWLQGLLKLGDKTFMGVIVPCLFFTALAMLPYLDNTPRRPLRRRPVALGLAVATVAVGIALSVMGTHAYGIHMPPAVRMAQDLAPEEGDGPLRAVPYDQLKVGRYVIAETDLNTLPPALAALMSEFENRVQEAKRSSGLSEAITVWIVEDWQADLKRVTLRIISAGSGSSGQNTFERAVYRHRLRDGG